MERKNVLIGILFGIAVVISILATIWIMDCKPDKPENFEEQDYSIEYLTPEVVRVVALSGKKSVASWGTVRGYGDCFARAIKELEKEYIIEEITPIAYKAGYGSVTRELLIKVKKKSNMPSSQE